jgi:formylglycine-generating enzyme required for sulfatase activity
MRWITVKETVELFVVTESTVRYAINKNQVKHSREHRGGRDVLVIWEDDATHRWARRTSDALVDSYFADLVERFDEKFPRGDESGLSAKQQFESKVYGKVGLPDGKPRSLSVCNIFEGAIGGTIANAIGGPVGGIIASVVGFASVRFLEFLKNAVDGGTPSPVPHRSNNLAISNSVGMRFVQIPNGTFLMGSPLDEKWRGDDEYQHKVTLSRDFYLGSYAVTQSQYQKVIGKNPSYFREFQVFNADPSNHPVDSVSHDDAVEFCRRLSGLPKEKAAGRRYRLPTEAEWEYACRAGSNAAYSFGNGFSLLGAHAWYILISRNMTHAVGGKKPNAFGLYDMHGNVWEWCSDWYDENYYARSPATDPKGPDSGTFRILRGGSWFNGPGGVRCASRSYFEPNYSNDGSGFRVVLE